MDALIVVVTALCTFSGQKVDAAGSMGREDGKWNDFAAGLRFCAVDALRASFQLIVGRGLNGAARVTGDGR